jgi:hypothetical protein
MSSIRKREESKMHELENGETGQRVRYRTKAEAMAALRELNRWDMHEPWYYCTELFDGEPQ